MIVNPDAITAIKAAPVYRGAIASLHPDLGFATLLVDGNPEMIVRAYIKSPEIYPHLGGPFEIGARFRFYITETLPHTRPPGIWAQHMAKE